MRILVTGGAGFIGSNFITLALQAGHKIINVDKLTYASNTDNINNVTPEYLFYQADICSKDTLQQIIYAHKPEIILHMAAETHVDRSIDCADEFIHTNVVGTHILLEVALGYFKQLDSNQNFKFIHLSTDEVFGSLSEGDKPFNENSPYQPNSPYAASKASSDLLVRSYYQTYGLPTIVINSSNNYGPKQYPEKLIPLTILNAMEHKPLPVYGNGEQIRDWLYVEDHVHALLDIISHGAIGESYCIGADNETSNLKLVHSICLILDSLKPNQQAYKQLIKFVEDRPGHDFRYAINAAKLKKHTGWHAKVNFQDGLLKTVKWYISHYENFRSNLVARDRLGLGVN